GDGDFSDPGELDAEDQGGVDGLDLQLGGADTLTVNLAGSLLAGQSKSLKVLLGPGTNLLNVGSTAAFTLNADARFLIDIVGGPGTDKVTLDFSQWTVAGGSLSVRGDLGPRSDVAVIRAPAVQPPGGFNGHLALGPGSNVLSYSDGVTGPDADVRLDVQGDTGIDNVTLSLGHPSWGRTYYAFDLGAGNDIFRANFDLAAFSLPGSQPFQLSVSGGPG